MCQYRTLHRHSLTQITVEHRESGVRVDTLELSVCVCGPHTAETAVRVAGGGVLDIRGVGGTLLL